MISSHSPIAVSKISHMIMYICALALNPEGVGNVFILVCASASISIFVQEDSSLTRSNAYMQKLFTRSGMQLKYSAKQKDFPKELYAVHMYALQPKR